MMGSNRQVIIEENENDGSESRSVSLRSQSNSVSNSSISQDERDVVLDVDKLSGTSSRDVLSLGSRMNECLKDRFGGLDPEIDGFAPQGSNKIQGMMSERNSVLSFNNKSRGLIAPLQN